MYDVRCMMYDVLLMQGDREKALGIPCSPLCDRQATLVEKSQIGFIDFIVDPSFSILGNMMEKIVQVFQNSPQLMESGVAPLTIVEDVEVEGGQLEPHSPRTCTSLYLCVIV